MQRPSEDLPLPEFKWLDLEAFEYLCFNMALVLLSTYEPIPEFSSVDVKLLESALGNPRQGIVGGLLYPTLSKQAAILFYSLIKNGNKRIAVMTMFAHLVINGKSLMMEPIQLYDLACDVAKSDPSEKEAIMARIEHEVETHSIDTPAR